MPRPREAKASRAPPTHQALLVPPTLISAIEGATAHKADGQNAEQSDASAAAVTVEFVVVYSGWFVVFIMELIILNSGGL